MPTNPPDAGKPARPPVPRVPTRLESVEEIRAALGARGAAPAAAPPAAPPAPAPGPAVPPPAAQVPLFRPSNRPPVAVLYVLDDGDEDGQRIRLRGDRFVIGRTEGDLVIPHDAQISGRHAELLRQQDEDGWHWLLTDLGSTNGIFVRAGSAVLKDGQEFLVGRSHYRFDAAKGEPAGTAPVPAAPGGATASWHNSGDQAPVPALVELTPAGPGARLPLLKAEYWIGSDATVCALVPPNDPFVNPRHAKLTRDVKGRWHIVNNKSVNGVWLRVEQMPLAGSCQFQLGEQRFLLRVPGP